MIMRENANWPDPTPEMLQTPEFNAIWERIKTWDINVPEVDGPGMYSGATGNHVRAILDILPLGLSASEAVVGFAAWLTTRAEAVTFGAGYDAAIAAELVKEFCEANKLAEPREGWAQKLTHPPAKYQSKSD
jgi:hypothetical protein